MNDRHFVDTGHGAFLGLTMQINRKNLWKSCGNDDNVMKYP
jgi:hypothetical protein